MKKINFKHNKAFYSSKDNYAYTEYDKHNRVVYYKLYKNNYWCMKFYDEPNSGYPVNTIPYNVIHSYWYLYN